MNGDIHQGHGPKGQDGFAHRLSQPLHKAAPGVGAERQNHFNEALIVERVVDDIIVMPSAHCAENNTHIHPEMCPSVVLFRVYPMKAIKRQVAQDDFCCTHDCRVEPADNGAD